MTSFIRRHGACLSRNMMCSLQASCVNRVIAPRAPLLRCRQLHLNSIRNYKISTSLPDTVDTLASTNQHRRRLGKSDNYKAKVNAAIDHAMKTSTSSDHFLQSLSTWIESFRLDIQDIAKVLNILKHLKYCELRKVEPETYFYCADKFSLAYKCLEKDTDIKKVFNSLHESPYFQNLCNEVSSKLNTANISQLVSILHSLKYLGMADCNLAVFQCFEGILECNMTGWSLGDVVKLMEICDTLPHTGYLMRERLVYPLCREYFKSNVDLTSVDNVAIASFLKMDVNFTDIQSRLALNKSLRKLCDETEFLSDFENAKSLIQYCNYVRKNRQTVWRDVLEYPLQELSSMALKAAETNCRALDVSNFSPFYKNAMLRRLMKKQGISKLKTTNLNVAEIRHIMLSGMYWCEVLDKKTCEQIIDKFMKLQTVCLNDLLILTPLDIPDKVSQLMLKINVDDFIELPLTSFCHALERFSTYKKDATIYEQSNFWYDIQEILLDAYSRNRYSNKLHQKVFLGLLFCSSLSNDSAHFLKHMSINRMYTVPMELLLLTHEQLGQRRREILKTSSIHPRILKEALLNAENILVKLIRLNLYDADSYISRRIWRYINEKLSLGNRIVSEWPMKIEEQDYSLDYQAQLVKTKNDINTLFGTNRDKLTTRTINMEIYPFYYGVASRLLLRNRYCKDTADEMGSLFSYRQLQMLDTLQDTNTRKKSVWKLKLLMFLLNQQACLLYPELQIPWLPSPADQILFSASCMQPLLKQAPLLDHALQACFGKNLKVVRNNIDVGYGVIASRCFLLDQKNKPVRFTVEKLQNSQKLGLKRYAMFYKHFLPHWRKESRMRFDDNARYLQILGFNVILITDKEWNSIGLTHRHDKIDYIRERIFNYKAEENLDTRWDRMSYKTVSDDWKKALALSNMPQ